MIFPYLETAIKNLTKKPLTEAFPCPEDMGAERYRGRISSDPEVCVDCFFQLTVKPFLFAVKLEIDVDFGFIVK